MDDIDFKNKKILVTGGAGSIGRELVMQLMNRQPSVIRILDNNETELFNLEQNLTDHGKILRFLVGDVRDKERMEKACEDIDFVFHTAALKHVYLCEYNPMEAIKTNVIGTQNVIDACLTSEVQKMIFISTDKAVNPTSVMGTTKLLAEKLVAAANLHKGGRRTIFATVRFGNVLASRGSVLPLFLKQIRTGNSVTLTDGRMTRFIMKPDAATELILKAAATAEGGELFILKMPSIRIKDLAEVMIDKFAGRYSKKPGDIEIIIIGAKPGEKIHEDLITDTEAQEAEERDDLIIIKPYYKTGHLAKKKENLLKNRNSEKTLSKDQIRTILDSISINE